MRARSRRTDRRPGGDGRRRRTSLGVEGLEGRQLLSGAARVVSAPHYQSFTGQVTGVAEHPLVSSPAPHPAQRGGHASAGAVPAQQYFANASSTALVPNGINPTASPTVRILRSSGSSKRSSDPWSWITGQFVDLSHYFNSLVRAPHRRSG